MALQQLCGIESDERILLYLPIFFVGLCLPYSIQNRFSIIKLVSSIAMIVMFEVLDIHTDSLYKYALFGCMVIAFLEIGKMMNKYIISSAICGWIGSVSLAAYLYHRQYLFVVREIVGKIPMIPMYLVVFPLLFLLLFVYKYVTSNFMVKKHIGREKES